MADNHIVKSFDLELNRLKNGISQMGNVCLEQISAAAEALGKRDAKLARKVIADDRNVNALQNEVEKMTINLLAMRQPVAKDLRIIVGSLKIASDLERIADYAANVARHINDLNGIPFEKPVDTIVEMTGQASKMMEEVIEAYRKLDVEKSIEVWRSDAAINRNYEELISMLRSLMGKECENVHGPTALMFMGRCCERMGDHIKNVAEHIFYIATGCMYMTDKSPKC